MTRIIIIAVLVVSVVSSVIYIRSQTPAAKPQHCFKIEPELRDQVRKLMHEGLDNALRQHLTNLFLSWMKDPFDQPHRAAEGANRGIKAYIDAHNDINVWDPAE